MALVTPGMLAALRTVAYQGLQSSATISRATQVETDFGSAESWSQVATGVPCWVRGVSIPNVVTDVAYREAAVGTFRIHFEQGVDVRPADKLTIDGRDFEVIDLNVENTIQIFTTVMAKKVE